MQPHDKLMRALVGIIIAGMMTSILVAVLDLWKHRAQSDGAHEVKGEKSMP